MNERLVRAGGAARVDLAHEPDFALGRIEVRPSLREIGVGGRKDIIEKRVMQVLVALVRAKGGVVSRDDLIESCWDGVIVADDAINSCISRLRRVAETSGESFSIETIPRVGYRLKAAEAVAAVSKPDSAVTPEPSSASPEASTSAGLRPPPSAKPAWTVRTTWIASVSTLLVLMAAGLGVGQFWPSDTAPKPGTAFDASVAVLPFVNMSGDPAKDYFSDGFSEELVNDLSNNPHLRVAARTSSFAFKGKNEDIESIARALRVHAVVEGSVRESGDRVRITAQLINGGDGYHLWSATYDRNLTDILSLQDELASAIAAALTHRLLPASSAPRPRIDPAVYRLYLEGVHEWNAFSTPENWRRALPIFKQVTERAPDFADGFGWLSLAALDLAVNEDAAPAPNYALASDAAQRALSLDPRNMRALFTRAVVELDAWDWRASAARLRILNSQNSDNYYSIAGLYNYYSNIGFEDEAFTIWRRLYLLDRQMYNHSFLTPGALDEVGRFHEEIGATQAILVKQPHSTSALAALCHAYAETGHLKDAHTVEERLRRSEVGDDSFMDYQACEWDIDFATGNLIESRKLLQVWEAEFPDNAGSAATIGTDFVLLGDFDKASDWLERAYERREFDFFRSFYLKEFGAQKAFEKYRMTPGYEALAKKPLFKKWQAEHDRIAAALAAHRDPLLMP